MPAGVEYKTEEQADEVDILYEYPWEFGEMKAGDDLYLKLMDYKATGRPIYCSFDSLACSGGYYVAMASDEICANRNCMCVNIGVYISTYNMTGLFEKLGVEQVTFKSSLTSIGNYAFRNCSSLVDIDQVTPISRLVIFQVSEVAATE